MPIRMKCRDHPSRGVLIGIVIIRIDVLFRLSAFRRRITGHSPPGVFWWIRTQSCCSTSHWPAPPSGYRSRVNSINSHIGRVIRRFWKQIHGTVLYRLRMFVHADVDKLQGGWKISVREIFTCNCAAFVHQTWNWSAGTLSYCHQAASHAGVSPSS